MRVGKDISICSMNIEPPAEFFCPAITGLQMPSLTGVLGGCFDWIFGANRYKGATLLEPEEASLFEGESTGKPTQRI